MISEIGPAGSHSEAGTPYESFVYKAKTEREAMNGLMQQLLNAFAERAGAKKVVWRAFPHVLTEENGTIAARVRCCFE